MSDGPTTMNGPLHTPEATLDDRMMTATYASADAARAAQQLLVSAGIAADRVVFADHAAAEPQVQAAAQASDPGVLGRIREAILPDDSQTATRTAMRNDEAILQVRPLPTEVELAVRTIQASNPARFDADLERWRNKG